MTRLTHWCNFDSARTRILEAGRAPTSPLYPPAPPSLQNNFERAQTDVFAVKGTDIGDVQRVVVWHDNSGPGPAWHLQQVEGGGGVVQRVVVWHDNSGPGPAWHLQQVRGGGGGSLQGREGAGTGSALVIQPTLLSSSFTSPGPPTPPLPTAG